MYTIKTDIHIDASTSTVWRILTDGKHLSAWNPFIHKLKGTLAEGEKLEIVVGMADTGQMRFTPTVLTSKPNQELRWRGKLGFRGVFDGEHVFKLIPTETGTHFVHSEQFSGVLAPLLKSKLFKETEPGFRAMNQALKQRCESDPEVVLPTELKDVS